MEALNQHLFLLINATADTPLWLISTAHFIARWLIYIVLATFIFQFIRGDKETQQHIIALFICALLAYLACFIIGKIYPHPRPFMVPIGKTYLLHNANASFPSGHATLMFSLGFYLLFSERTFKERKLSGKTQSAWLILLLGVAISWARVFLGVHFPFDILGAIPVSLLAAYLTWRLASYLCPPRSTPPQRRT